MHRSFQYIERTLNDCRIRSHIFFCRVVDTSLTGPTNFSHFFSWPVCLLDFYPFWAVLCEVSRLLALETHTFYRTLYKRCLLPLGTIALHVPCLSTRVIARCSCQVFSPRIIFLAFRASFAALEVFISRLLLSVPFRLFRSYLSHS